MTDRDGLIPDMEVLIDCADTPTGLGIARDALSLFVFAPCCREYVYRKKDGTKLEWFCDGCDGKLFGKLPTSGHSTMGLWSGTDRRRVQVFTAEWTGHEIKDITVEVRD